MRVVLLADDGTLVLTVEDAQRYSLLDLAAHLRLAIIAVAEGWDLPDPMPINPAGDARILAAVEPNDPPLPA